MLVIKLFLNGLFNPFISVPKVCEFSKKFWDIHDYKIPKGGDGTPSHFYIYQCYNCGKEFGI